MVSVFFMEKFLKTVELKTKGSFRLTIKDGTRFFTGTVEKKGV